MPNPWRGYELIRGTFDALLKRYPREQVTGSYGDAFHQVFVIGTKGLHLKQAADTAYKRSVFDICSEHARKADWAEFVPAMSKIGMRFEIVDECHHAKQMPESPPFLRIRICRTSPLTADLGNMAIPNGRITRRLQADHCVLWRRYDHIQGLPIPLPQQISCGRCIVGAVSQKARDRGIQLIQEAG